MEPELDPAFEAQYECSDDEETIAQEELLEPVMDPKEELKLLADDLNVSVEELLESSACKRSSRRKTRIDYQEMHLKRQLLKQKQKLLFNQPKSLAELSSKAITEVEIAEPCSSSESFDDPKNIAEDSELTKFYTKVLSDSLQSDEEDNDYKPLQKVEHWREIRLGPDYQAEVCDEPSLDSKSTIWFRNLEELLWKPPDNISEQILEDYLKQASNVLRPNGKHIHPVSVDYSPDNEEALKYLLKANFDPIVAIEMLTDSCKASQDCCENCVEDAIGKETNEDSIRNEYRHDKADNKEREEYVQVTKSY